MKSCSLKSELTDYPGCLYSENLTLQDLREGGRYHPIPDFCSEEQNNHVKYFQKSITICDDNHLNSSSITKDETEGKGPNMYNSPIAITETDGIFLPTTPRTKEYGVYNRKNIRVRGRSDNQNYSQMKAKQNDVDIADKSDAQRVIIDEASGKVNNAIVAKVLKEEKTKFQVTNSNICSTTNATPEMTVSSCKETAVIDLKNSINDLKRTLQKNNSTHETHDPGISASFTLNDLYKSARSTLGTNHTKIFPIEPTKTSPLQHTEPKFLNLSSSIFSAFPRENPLLSLANCNETVLGTYPVLYTGLKTHQLQAKTLNRKMISNMIANGSLS